MYGEGGEARALVEISFVVVTSRKTRPGWSEAGFFVSFTVFKTILKEFLGLEPSGVATVEASAL